MFSLHLPLLAALCVGALAGRNKYAAITTAPIYLPHYNEESWSLVRGSIIGLDEAAQQTTYTIFCPNEDPPKCDLSLDFPFVLVEGPSTVEFHGTYTSTFIADLGCTLKGSTEATCSGYSSYKSGYTYGLYTGPTEVSWTSTFTGSDVEWGVLTMAEKPKETEVWDRTVSAIETPAAESTQFTSLPRETGVVNAGERRTVADWRVLVSMVAVFAGFAL